MGDVINGLLLGGLLIWRLGKTNDRLACVPLLDFMFGIWVGVVTGDREADICCMARMGGRLLGLKGYHTATSHDTLARYIVMRMMLQDIIKGANAASCAEVLGG